MSKLLEYIKLLPKALPNIGQIIESYTNQVKMELGTIPEEDLEVIVGRRLICSECPYMSENARKMGVYAGHQNFPHCTFCGCPISTRTASLDAGCGIEEFNIKNLNNQIPLKWEAVKPKDNV